MRYEFLHRVDHGQFYLADETYTTDTSTFWTTQEIDDTAVIRDDILAVGTMLRFVVDAQRLRRICGITLSKGVYEYYSNPNQDVNCSPAVW
jgi:phosphoribosylaminoimidazole-succinocarboxamide synthase